MRTFLRISVARLCVLSFSAVGMSQMLAGCATINRGPRQTIQIDSMPSGAKVFVNDVELTQTTPTAIALKRKASAVVLRVEKEGYEPVKMGLHRVVDRSSGLVGDLSIFFLGSSLMPPTAYEVDAQVVLSLALGSAGLMGLAVDFISGSAYKLNPSAVYVELIKLKK